MKGAIQINIILAITRQNMNMKSIKGLTLLRFTYIHLFLEVNLNIMKQFLYFFTHLNKQSYINKRNTSSFCAGVLGYKG